jgi:hypothetical protein
MVYMIDEEIKMNILIDAFEGSRYRRNLAEAVCHFCISQMLPRLRTIDIMIELMPASEFEQGVKGYCFAMGSREFKIEMCNNQAEDEFIKSLCHEMVHIKQFIREEFVEEVMDYQTIAEYFNQPSEKEAYKMEEVLYKEWLQVKRETKKS